jgi:hypothetical protein
MFWIQNFTVRWTSNLLPPHSEVTVEYKFKPDEKLEPLDFHLSGWVIYNDSSSTPIIYRSLFFNQTVEVLEKSAGWSVQSFFTTLLILAGVALGGYVLLSQTAFGKKAAKRATAVAHSAQDKAAAWEVAQVYKPKAVQKAAGAKQMKKPVQQSGSNKQ